MLKRSSINPDVNEVASPIARAMSEESVLRKDDGKNPHAVALGRLGGKRGGPARAEKLSAERRSAIAKLAAEARWGGKGKR